MQKNKIIVLGRVYYPSDFVEGLRIVIVTLLFGRSRISSAEAKSLYERLQKETTARLNMKEAGINILRLEYSLTAWNTVEARATAVFFKKAVEETLGVKLSLADCVTVESEHRAINRALGRRAA